MRRDSHDGEPFYARPLEKTARKAYREPGEAVDDRPVIRYQPFWRDAAEEYDWTEATRKVMAAPDWATLPLEQRLGLIAAAAGHETKPKKLGRLLPTMPFVKPLSEAEYNRRMAELRAQAERMWEPGEDREEWWKK